MRLKFLFFPIVLVICFAVFVGWIWPEIENIKKINQEGMVDKQNLQSIKDKQIVIADIQNNGDKDAESLIKNYLPDKKSEEKIIGGLNYLATDSGVTLANLSIKDPSLASSTQANAAQAVPSGGLKYSEASVVVSGEYGKIKYFLDQVQSMSLFNSIKMLSISKPEHKNTSGEEGTSPDTSLLANIIINFGYFESSKIDNQKAAAFDAVLDNSTIDVLEKYVSQKTPSMTETESKGKDNPFFP